MNFLCSESKPADLQADPLAPWLLPLLVSRTEGHSNSPMAD